MNTDNQMLMLVDENDTFLGEYEKRIVCHTGIGIRHRAFTVLVENNKGEVLMQKRKHALWDGFWDMTAISHNLHLEDHDESYAEAGNRALQVEMGIPTIELKNVGGFPYFVKFGKMCENEYCAVLLGSYNGKVHPNKEVIYDYKWVNKKTFIAHCLKEDPTYTPWAILAGRLLEVHE
jgi:isopentenyl-diphosphate delta-isomerase